MNRFLPGYRAKLGVSVGALTLGILYCAPAAAQTARATANEGAGTVSEVVVTAERRATDIQKTPLAITSVPAQRLDKSFINDITGLNGEVPSLETTKTSGFETIVTIRGVGSGTPENDLVTVPGVALFVDGVYLVNTTALDQTLFDVDHIEVLRGPQGALYGDSSIGGAIIIDTKQPELGVFGGQGDVSVGNYDLARERAEVNLPLGNTLAARFSIQKYNHEGFAVDEAIPGFREDNADDISTKAALLWKPVSNFSATLTGEWYRSFNNGAEQKNINDPTPGPYNFYQDYPGKTELDTQLYHLNMHYDLPWFTIRSVSGYQHISDKTQEDSSRSAFSLLGSYDDVAAWNTTVSSFSEEFDILSRPGSRLDWIVGGYYLHSQSRQFVAEFEGTTPNPDLAILPNIETSPPGNLAYGDDARVLRQSYAVFGQATYSILPSLRLTLGARYNEDSFAISGVGFSRFGISGAPVPTESGHVPTWRAEADYDLTSENLVYASAARGYKPGGLNGQSGSLVVGHTYKAETNTAFEVGSKNFLFGRSLRLNVDGFYYLYDNMQYIETDPIPFDAAISNIPSVHVYGVEAEASYVGMGDHLHINGSLAVEDGKIQGSYFTLDSTIVNAIENAPPPSPCAYNAIYYNPACAAAVIASEKNIGGNIPPALPTVSGSVDASYTFDLPSGTLTPRVEYVYRGSEWARIFNVPSLDHVPAYGVTNLNLQYLPTGSRLQLSVTATNVFNVAGVNSRYTDYFGTGQTSQQFIPPRQIIFSVGYSF